MPDPPTPAPVNVVDAQGQPGTVASPAELRRALATGDRPMSDAELQAFRTRRAHETSISEGLQAQSIGKVRGIGEAVGFPVDEAALSVADLFDKRKQVREHLQGLKENHPWESGYGQFAGQVGTGIAGGEVLGLGAGVKAPSVAGRIAHGVGEGALRGGLENMVAGATTDVNEAALGDQKLAGEKVFASLPKHFAIGMGAGVVLGGFGSALGEAAGAAARHGAPALESRATGLVGRELGLSGEEASRVGAHVRGGFGGEIPKSANDIADFFGREQAGYRSAANDVRASSLDDLASQQVGEAAGLSASHEASRFKDARMVQDAVDGVAERHAATRDGLSADREQAVDVAKALEGEVKVNADKLKSLAGDLDKVKGAERPRVGNVLRPAGETLGIDPDAGLGAYEGKVNRPVSTFANGPLTETDLPRVIAEVGPDEAKIKSIYAASGTGHEATEGWIRQAKVSGGFKPAAAGDRIVSDLGTGAKQAAGLYPSVYRNAAVDVEAPNLLRMAGAAPSVTESLQQPVGKAFATWTTGFKKLFPDGEVPFVKMGEVIGSLESVVNRTRDPSTKRAFSTLLDAARAEFDRASEVTSAMTGDAQSLNAERLRSMAPNLKTAHENALSDVARHDKLIAHFDKQSAAEMAEVQANAAIARGDAEKAMRAERKALDGAHKAQTKGVPAASEETPADDMVARAKAAQGRADERANQPLISPHAALGAILSAGHGNFGAAAASLGGSFAAGRARAVGNLGAAQALHAVANQLTKVDEAIRSGAGRAVRGAVAEGANVAARDVAEEATSGKQPSYKQVTERVRATQANPAILAERVKQQIGPLATYAPNVYSSTLSTAQRAQAFLEAAIPPSRRDPYSPTSHLEPDDVSEAERYDYMQYVSVIRDPMSAFRNVSNGTITEQQVAALKAVYPGLYAQMKREVGQSMQGLQKPLDYTSAIHLGLLLDAQTSQVMQPDFQRGQAQMYAARVKSEHIKTGGGPPAGPNARMSKSSMSGSQQLEAGD